MAQRRFNTKLTTSEATQHSDASARAKAHFLDWGIKAPTLLFSVIQPRSGGNNPLPVDANRQPLRDLHSDGIGRNAMFSTTSLIRAHVPQDTSHDKSVRTFLKQHRHVRNSHRMVRRFSFQRPSDVFTTFSRIPCSRFTTSTG